LLNSEISAGAASRKFFIPFHYIFDCIDELPDNGALFTGYGQRIKMNIRLNAAGECLNAFGIAPGGAAAPAYQIRRM
jgi:hypothetical protein